MKKYGPLIWGALLVVGSLLFYGCGSKSEANQASHNPSASDQPGKKASRKGKPFSARDSREIKAVPVEITLLASGDIASFLLYSAPLETEQTVTVYSRIPGLVEKIFVEEGQHVTRNQPLLQLEQREYQLAEERARLEYERQAANFRRLQALQSKNLVSDEEFQNAQLQMKQAEIAWKEAKLNLDYTVVRAPIDGVVGERMVRLGDRIQPSNSLFVISNLAEKVVRLHVPQDELAQCYINQKANITTDVLPGKVFAGWVKRISPIIDPQSGTFKVTVGVRDPENALPPGLFVQVQLIEDLHQDVPLLPKMALLYENERRYFFVLDGDTARKVELQAGYEDAQKVEVHNAIPQGTPVVVLGQNGLREGTLVHVTNVRTFPWQKNIQELLAKYEARKQVRPEKPAGSAISASDEKTSPMSK